jgi:hypothetical protein
MKKKDYQKPSITIAVLLQQTSLLAGSTTDDVIKSVSSEGDIELAGSDEDYSDLIR